MPSCSARRSTCEGHRRRGRAEPPADPRRQHTLTVSSVTTPLQVDGDLQRLTQVFGNLLRNAAKYSQPGGEIAVRASQEGGVALVRISDKGFGIPKERIGSIFDMFSQVPEHRSLVGGGGLGLGLALCRQLVELHGGSIEARSEGLGNGSEFIVRLALVAAAREQAEPPAAERAAARRAAGCSSSTTMRTRPKRCGCARGARARSTRRVQRSRRARHVGAVRRASRIARPRHAGDGRVRSGASYPRMPGGRDVLSSR